MIEKLFSADISFLDIFYSQILSPRHYLTVKGIEFSGIFRC